MPIPKHLHRRAIKAAIRRTRRTVSIQDCLRALGDTYLRDAARQVFAADANVHVVDRDTVELILARSTVDELQYVAEENIGALDCDDFAALLRADFIRQWRLNSCWEVRDYGGGHAYSLIFFDDAGAVRPLVIEPQTDGVVALGAPSPDGQAYTGRDTYLWP